MDKFEKWFNKVNEELTESPTINTEVADVTVTDMNADRSNMIGDIDNIMTSLETLAGELTEELTTELDLNEGVGDFIQSWLISRKAVKAQKKVNKIKMNASDLEFAADKFEGDKKKSMQAKSQKVNDQAKELQAMVNDRFSGKGSLVDSKLAKTKIEGQLQIIKRTSGMEDNPNKKSDMKTKMQELTAKYKKETEAINSLEDGNEDAIAAEKKRAKEKAKKSGKVEGEPANKVEGEPAQETEEERLAKETKVDDSVQIDNDLINRARNLNLNELATEIESKLDWQITEESVLRSNYEAIIKKAESDQILNESKHQVNSIKEAFKRLM